MNIKKLLILAPVAVLSMTSCGKRGVRHDTGDYFIEARHARYDNENENAGMNILQLSDLHLGTNCDRKVQYAFIQKTINEANNYVKNRVGSNKEKLDMIVITGDVFTFGTKEIAKDFVNFMEKQQIDWTLTFGNHDEQCYFSVDWLTGYLNSVSQNKDSYLLFKDHQDDDVFGNANFVITVPDTKENKDEERLYIFDSNRYRYQIGSYGYDYIHHDQIDWYERCTRYNPQSKLSEEPDNIHSTAYFHIPFEEFNDYYKEAKNKKEGKGGKGEFISDEDGSKLLETQKEGVSCPKENTHLFDKMVDLNTTQGVFVGHDHVNNSAIKTDKNKLILSFGVKGTDTVYADDELMGGQVIHISGKELANKEIKIHTILHKYSDLEVK